VSVLSSGWFGHALFDIQGVGMTGATTHERLHWQRAVAYIPVSAVAELIDATAASQETARKVMLEQTSEMGRCKEWSTWSKLS
jgi:hypothetical protein